MNDQGRIKVWLFLHILLMVYSMCGIFSKMAGKQPFLSLRFCFFYGMVIIILGIYALGWQQVIKRLPLTTAFANKAVTIVWGLIWGVIFFGEKVTIGKVAGISLVVGGIVLFAFSDNKSGDEENDNE